ncbi:MAG TPA: hypothetical protein VHJ82_04515 [Actinomycetota bacterium]|nr:hypothetical protein [Actinomycetota bacterium]
MTTSRIPERAVGRAGRLFGVRTVLGVWMLGLAVAGGVGCAKAQARTSPDGPPLDMPAPPARVLTPADEPVASAPAEPVEPAPAPTTNRRPTRRVNSEPVQKPETPAATPEPTAPQAAPIENRPVEPQPTLRAPGSAEKPIRDRLTAAQANLSRVDYAKLSTDGRSQYEQSKRFIQQAEQALKDQNFVFAQTLADKAATLAAELLGR